VSAFEPLFVPDPLRDAVSGAAWLGAMLDAERALARANERAGVVPAAAAAAIADACAPDAYDWDVLLEQGRAVGNPVEPLVRALRARVDAEHARYVHFGATSQDVLDTAAMLVTRDALGLVAPELDRLAGLCAGLARAHRSTPAVARTLLQHAVPTTFGLVAAGWLVGVLDARQRVVELREHGLAAQLGGAAGTLAALGDVGLRVAELFAAELALEPATLPWHTNRVRIAELGAALATSAGVAAKIGLDVALRSQIEVGEVREAAGGGSSTMPQKQNPVHATMARACARAAAGHASVLQASLAGEYERAAGAWHAEWDALNGVLACGGAAVAAAAASLDGLVVDADRMRANLDMTGGLVVSERVAFRLADVLGRDAGQELVAAATATEQPFREALLADPRLPLSETELDALLDPTTYVGSAEALTDRALARYDDEVEVSV